MKTISRKGKNFTVEQSSFAQFIEFGGYFQINGDKEIYQLVAKDFGNDCITASNLKNLSEKRTVKFEQRVIPLSENYSYKPS